MASKAHPAPQCPTCHSPLTIAALECEPCEIRIEGRFHQASTVANEFSSLSGDDLHLLRIFVHCEGSIRDMESALGISYPTIKSRLAKLRERLTSTHESSFPAKQDPPPRRRLKSISDVLAALEAEEISHSESVKLIKEIKSGRETK